MSETKRAAAIATITLASWCLIPVLPIAGGILATIAVCWFTAENIRVALDCG